MKLSEHDLFEQLEPPPGGQQALRERLVLERQRRRRFSARFAALTAATAAAVALVIWLAVGDDTRAATPASAPPPRTIIDEQSHAHPALVAVDSTALLSEPVSVRADNRHQYAVRRVQTDNQRVVFYMVSSQSHPLRPDAP